MNYVHTIEVIRKISSPTGEVLFVYPANTLLDFIILDLWPIIINHFIYEFVIGNYNKQYSGYRLVNNDDIKIQKFKDDFKNYYKKNNGILSIDDVYSGILFFDKKSTFVYRYFCLQCSNFNNDIIKKYTFGSFKTIEACSEKIMENFDFKIGSNKSPKNVGLFIRDGDVFK